MAGANQYLPFAYASGANVESASTYNSETLRAQGHVPGVAKSEVANTTWRQTSVAVSGIAQMIAEVTNSDVLDNGDRDAFKTLLTAAINTLINGQQHWHTGDVKSTLDPTDQTGWVFADGRAVSRTGATAALFAKFGTTYGIGDGSTTFNVPDLRGEFLRGLDAGRGVDGGRSLGAFQDWATAAPKNTNPTRVGGAALTYGASNPSQIGFARASKVGEAVTASGFDSDSAGIEIDAANVTTGDSETRPRNVAVRYLIKL